MKTLDSARKEIDSIDKQLLGLLNRRALAVKDIFEIKGKQDLPAFDPSRERKIIEKLLKNNPGPLKDDDINSFMELIFQIYRGMFRNIRVAFLGPEGTFTQQAGIKKFGDKAEYLSCRITDNVFREVEKGRADYGVIPIENSMEGVVTHTLDMFMESTLKITDEIILDVHHYLMSHETSFKNIKKLYSHTQAISQCWSWLSENLPNIKIVETESTAKAAKTIQNENGAAAIGSIAAARLYKIPVLSERIEDFNDNITRFLVIGKEFSKATDYDKTSIMVSVKDRVGALHDILVIFKKHDINLTRIESRPSKKKAWDYVFFFDFMGHKDNENSLKALKKIEEQSVFLKILGSYPSDKNRREST